MWIRFIDIIFRTANFKGIINNDILCLAFYLTKKLILVYSTMTNKINLNKQKIKIYCHPNYLNETQFFNLFFSLYVVIPNYTEALYEAIENNYEMD